MIERRDVDELLGRANEVRHVLALIEEQAQIWASCGYLALIGDLEGDADAAFKAVTEVRDRLERITQEVSDDA